MIDYLKNSGAKNDNLEGLGYFLDLNFKTVVFDYEKIKLIDLIQIEKLKPDIVTRETNEGELEDFYLILLGFTNRFR